MQSKSFSSLTFFRDQNFFGTGNFQDQKFSGPKPKFFGSKIFWTQRFLGTQDFWTQNFLAIKIFHDQKLGTENFFRD